MDPRTPRSAARAASTARRWWPRSVDRLRAAGVPVTLRAMSAFAQALDAAPPAQVPALYWLARVTLVNRHHDLAVFDAVFEAVFGDAVLRGRPARPPDGRQRRRRHRGRAGPGGGRPAGGDVDRRRCPGTPCRRRRRPTEDDGGERALPELLPSAVARIADTPFDELDEAELALLGAGWRSPRRVADPSEPAPAGRAGGSPGRAARDDRRLAAYRLGADGAAALPPRAPPADRHAPLRRQPVDAELRHRLPAPDARASRAPGRAETFAFSTS